MWHYFRTLSTHSARRMAAGIDADMAAGEELVIPIRRARSMTSLPTSWEVTPRGRHSRDGWQKIARLERRRLARKTVEQREAYLEACLREEANQCEADEQELMEYLYAGN